MTTSQPPPPPLPLRNDIEKLVFTHKSLYGKAAGVYEDAEDPQDWERIAFLGEGVLMAATSRLMYDAYPRYRTSWLYPNRTKFLSKESLASITDAYRFMDKMKCLEASRNSITKSLDNRCALAQSFVGGLALQYGMDAAIKWAEDVLAWRHDLQGALMDARRLGLEGQNDVGGTTGPIRGIAAAYSPPPNVPPPVTPSAPPTFDSRQTIHRSVFRPEHAQIRPPQEVPIPGMGHEAPPQHPMYGPAMYQGGVVHPQAAAMPGPPTYGAGAPPYYPHYSSQQVPHAVPYQPRASPSPAPRSTSPPHQPTDYRNFGYNNPPPQSPYYSSMAYQQAPPPPQPQFQSPIGHIPSWGPQIPVASSLPYGPPSPSGPKAIPNKEGGSTFDPASI